MSSQLPADLSFINGFRIKANSFESATWLKSSFFDSIWMCLFGNVELKIDFNIFLEDGLMLTAPVNEGLLNNIKNFLCLQTHPLWVGKVALSSQSQRAILTRSLHILDYFFLHSEYYKLSNYGFSLVTPDNIRNLIQLISQHRSIKNNIYQPRERVIEYLCKVHVSLDDRLLTISRYPEIAHTDECESFDNFSSDQLVTARIWLKCHGLYRSGSKKEIYRHMFQQSKFLKIIIGKRIISNIKFDDIGLNELNFSPRESYQRELFAVPVANSDEDERVSSEYVQSYLHTICSMRFANKHGVNLIPDQALSAIDEKEFISHDIMRNRGRFKTLPFQVVNKSLVKAIEFYFQYGKSLVDYYVSLASSGAERIGEHSLKVPPPLNELGICRWSIRKDCTREQYFHQLRSGTGLYEMFQVLIGSIVIIVNTLMARRSSELLNLSSESIVHSDDGYYLAFNLSKANVGDWRERVLRPMPGVAAEALLLLKNMSDSLSVLGCKFSHKLFQIPANHSQHKAIALGTISLDRQSLALCLNRFCDYFQIQNDDFGRRYYIRTHQLRRNFAILFFWHGSFGGVDVLRYFLGHSKASMTYNYITEAISGKILARIKASAANQLIKTSHEKVHSLADFVCKRYGLSREELYILPENDVIAYVEDLLANGEAEIEPEFVEGPNGEEFTVVYKITKL